MESRAEQRREVVVITGASAGVGRATAREFARGGAAVALIARGEDGLEAARREVVDLGGEALVLPTDVAEAAEVEAAAGEVERCLGPIDVWINNAMVTVLAPVHDMTPEDFRRVTEVTYLGAVHGTLAALSRMRPRGRGTIVQVGSALAYRAIPLQSAYCAAKYALRGFTDALRVELLRERSRVHVTMVQLPALDTPQFTWTKTTLGRHPRPVAPVFRPEVAARAIHWAAHRRRREVWVGGPTVQAILAQRLAPWLADRVLARRAFEGQTTGEPVPQDRLHNLYHALPGDHGASGPFGAEARSHSLQLAATRHRGWLVGAATLLGGAALGLLLRPGGAPKGRGASGWLGPGGRGR